MKVCVVGAGGREHALAHALRRCGADVIASPGNPGMASVAECTPAPPEEVDADLFVVGPEAPLVSGLADRLRSRGCRVLGPGADGARLEGSKAWMKDVVAAAGVPSAAHATFAADQLDEALAFLRTLPGLYVVKTDGLAAGKGVLVTESLADAEEDVRAKLGGSAFGAAGTTVVIEEGMVGPELSVLAICDGERAVALAPARDHKRLGDGDTGPNTGGMGAFSPVPGAGDDLVDVVLERFVDPTLAELRRRGIEYRGVLYAGLMLTADGPKLVEFNVRLGDPEAQVVLPRVDGDLPAVLLAAAEGDLGRAAGAISTSPDAAVTVVLATPGYPSSPRTGDPITGIDDAEAIDGVTVYHAGTAPAPDGTGRLVTAGGRVCAVTALAPDLDTARRRAYLAADSISWSGVVKRSDIAATASPTNTPLETTK